MLYDTNGSLHCTTQSILLGLYPFHLTAVRPQTTTLTTDTSTTTSTIPTSCTTTDTKYYTHDDDDDDDVKDTVQPSLMYLLKTFVIYIRERVSCQRQHCECCIYVPQMIRTHHGQACDTSPYSTLLLRFVLTQTAQTDKQRTHLVIA